MDRNKQIEELRSQVKVYSKPEKKTGGQTVGVVYSPPIIVEHEELRIKIEVQCHRSMHKNRELALMLFNLAFDDIIK